MEKAKKPTFLVLDAYSSGRLYPEIFSKKFKDDSNFRLVHIQSTPNVMGVMSPFEAEKYHENIVYRGDIEATLSELTSQYGDDIKAVIVGQEPGVELADLLSERLGLANSNGTAKSAARRDKYLMRKVISEAGLAAPKFVKSNELDTLLNWIEEETHYPVVSKVLRSASSDGVYICRNTEEVINAFNKGIGHKSFMEDINTEMLIEAFLPGDEYIVDAVSLEGKHYVVGIWKYEKRYVPGHGNLYDRTKLIPSDSPEAIALMKYNDAMLDALEINYGASHAEIMLTPDGPVLVEVGARFNGLLHTEFHNICLGHNQADLTVDCYANPALFLEKVAAFPYTMKQAAMSIDTISEEEGMIESINETVLEAIKALPSVLEVVVKRHPGQKLEKTTNLLNSPVRVFMTHESEEQIEADYKILSFLTSKLFRLRS